MTITALGAAISTTNSYFAGNNPVGQLQSLTLSNGNTIQFGTGTVGGGQTNNAATAVFANASGETIGTVNLAQVNGGGGVDIGRICDVTALTDGGFAVSYIGSGAVSPGIYNNFAQCVKAFNADGTARGEGQFVHAVAGPIGFESQIVGLPGGGFTVVFDSIQGQTTLTNFITLSPGLGGGSSGTASTGIDIRMRTFNANAVATTSELLVTTGTIDLSTHSYNRQGGNQYVTDVDVLANGNIAITYLGDRFSLNGTSALYSNVAVYNPLTLAPVFGELPYAQGTIAGANAAVFTSFNQNPFLSAVLSNGLIAGVYEGSSLTGNKVVLQLVNAAGGYVNQQVDLLLDAPNTTFTTRTWGMVALNDDSFVLGIARNAPGGGTDDLFLRQYSTNGVLISETQIANTATGLDYIQSLEKGPDGSLLVSWSNSQQNGGSLIQQRYVVTSGTDIPITGGATGDVHGGAGGNDWIDGGAGDDIINGFGGVDRLYGDSGNDTISGGTGNDTINGGTGTDTAVFEFSRSGATITRTANGTITVTGGGFTDILKDVEFARFTDATVNLLGKVATDLNGDGKGDILWRNADGTVATWLMNGTTLASGGNIGAPGNDWKVMGSGDFDGDGKGDILWRNANGTVAAWLLNGTAIASGGNIGAPGNDWKVVGSGDFNGDGKDDILWRNTNGTVAAWLLNGTSITTGGNIGAPGLDWHVVGTGDFNGDGKDDILWRHNDGTVAAWLLDGTSITSGGNIGQPGNDWKVADTGDFNGDGKDDILWRRDDGTVAAWMLNGTSIASGGNIGQPGNDWHIDAATDLNGDGKCDIIWRNTNGTVAGWLLDGTTIVSGGNIGQPGNTWQVQNHNYDFL